MLGKHAMLISAAVALWTIVSPAAAQPPSDRVPKRITSASPVYPAAAARLHLRGPVVVRLTIGPRGRVESATAVRGNRLLVDAAVAATRKWRFQPAGQRRRLLAAVSVQPADPKTEATVSPPPLTRRATGRVSMTLAINVLGQVSDALAWSGPEDAQVEALEAALRWETEPLVEDGAARAFECPSQWWSSGSGAIRVGSVILPALRCVTAEPDPVAAPTAEAGGTIAIVEVVIEPKGTVSRAKVLRPGSMPDYVALETARRMRFGPTFLGGVAIPVIQTVIVPSGGPGTSR